MKESERKGSRFKYIERPMLIVVFFFTAISTFYSIRLAKKSLDQYSIEMRPWISIAKTDTHFRDKDMLSKFPVTNIGKIPAYIKCEIECLVNGKSIEVENPEFYKDPLAILPNQTVYMTGLNISGPRYEEILKRKFKGKITQSLRIDYGISKDRINSYYIYKKVEFNIKNIPDDLKNLEKRRLWIILESDFR